MDKLEKIFTEWDDADDFSGVISITQKGTTVYEKVDGFRNRGEELPNQIDTAFGIASGTKLFTSTAICQLIDQGKISLESKLHDLLTHDLGNIPKEVTVLHLLSHSSGIADYLDFNSKEEKIQFFDTHPVNLWTSNEYYLPLFSNKPPAFALGEGADYSNSNFILLGLIIEAVSGMGYREYVMENIIKPLGLTRTGFHATNNLPANTAVGYAWDSKAEVYVGNYFRLPIIGAADGGLYTTAGDLEKFWTALLGGKLYSSKMLEEVLTPRGVFEDIGGHFGLGIFVSEKDGKKVYWHDGGDYGVGFCTAYFPGNESVLSILVNVSVDLLSLSDEMIEAVAAI